MVHKQNDRKTDKTYYNNPLLSSSVNKLKYLSFHIMIELKDFESVYKILSFNMSKNEP